ncbi:MAG: peptidoglycan-binding protein [Stenomitos rutilans HA7619-LM2]|jgi:peptidoglycan hydrolase-like protein with peptidoglycan-binding domain|nr:peptidoglycan-binding protein [Stenomitos rutilans HA7619-LM2]
MDKMQAVSSKPQTLNLWLLRRVAFSLIGMSFWSAVLLHHTTANVCSQVSAATIDAGTPTEALLRPTLNLGSRGAEVTELQATLQLLGYYGGTVDGVYGQSTVSAVSQFQQAAGLSADGITGPATWNRLFPTPAELPSSVPAPATSATPAPGANTAKTPPASTSAASFPVPAGASPNPVSTQPATKPRPAVKPASSATTSKPGTTTSPPTSATTTATATNTSVALPVLKQGMKGPAVVALQERLRSLGVFKGSADGVFGAETLAAVKAAQRKLKLEPDGVVGGGTWSALLR